jgi:hypothetical protein
LYIFFFNSARIFSADIDFFKIDKIDLYLSGTVFG